MYFVVKVREGGAIGQPRLLNERVLDSAIYLRLNREDTPYVMAELRWRKGKQEKNYCGIMQEIRFAVRRLHFSGGGFFFFFFGFSIFGGVTKGAWPWSWLRSTHKHTQHDVRKIGGHEWECDAKAIATEQSNIIEFKRLLIQPALCSS